MDIVLAQYEAGTTDLTRVTLLQQNLVPLEDTLAQGEIATGLIQVYRALGGGREIRLAGGNQYSSYICSPPCAGLPIRA